MLTNPEDKMSGALPAFTLYVIIMWFLFTGKTFTSTYVTWCSNFTSNPSVPKKVLLSLLNEVNFNSILLCTENKVLRGISGHEKSESRE
jgi:hypothetical protein